MVEKTLGKIPAVTIAQMIKLRQKPEPLFLSGDFFETLLETLRPQKAEESSAVMILCGGWPTPTNIIRIIPTKCPKVLKLKIEFSKKFWDRGDFLKGIGNFYMRNNLKSIYSTGPCLCDLPCIPYEAYIDSDDLQISEEQLKSELLTIPSIGNVEVTDVD